MNFNLSTENEEFLERYKALGYSTKTALLNDALLLFKKGKAKELRAAKRAEMLQSYAQVKPEHLLGELDAEGFED